MSNRRKPRRAVPLGPAAPAPQLFGIVVEWTDYPAANYPTQTMEWIAEHQGEARRMNVWQCEECGEEVLCYDQHPGVTPFMVSHATLGDPDCPGLCRSHFYSGLSASVARDRQGGPTHEWYRPSAQQLRRESAATRDHVLRGGLLVREVTP